MGVLSHVKFANHVDFGMQLCVGVMWNSRYKNIGIDYTTYRTSRLTEVKQIWYESTLLTASSHLFLNVYFFVTFVVLTTNKRRVILFIRNQLNCQLDK
jgi:hypothetical protein